MIQERVRRTWKLTYEERQREQATKTLNRIRREQKAWLKQFEKNRRRERVFGPVLMFLGTATVIVYIIWVNQVMLMAVGTIVACVGLLWVLFGRCCNRPQDHFEDYEVHLALMMALENEGQRIQQQQQIRHAAVQPPPDPRQYQAVVHYQEQPLERPPPLV